MPGGDAADSVPGDFLGLGAALDLRAPAPVESGVGDEPLPDPEPEQRREQSDASWLMEFDDQDSEGAPFEELEAPPGDGDPPASDGRLWVGRVAIALVSMVCGALGARSFLGGEQAAMPSEQVVVLEATRSRAPRVAVEARPDAVESAASGVLGTSAASGRPVATATPITPRKPSTPAPAASVPVPLPVTPPATGSPFGPVPAEALEEIAASRSSAPDHGPPAPLLAATSPSSGSTADPLPSRAVRSLTMPIKDMVLLPAAKGAAREAGPADLANLWPTADIPIERVQDALRLLTPKVGRVRVTLLDGAVFEGRLVAVGEQKVWLQLAAGRLAVMGWQVERIEHLLSPEGTPTMGAPGSEHLAGLPQVRVRTPGGVFYGKLLAHEGDRVTLVTVEGARLTLDDAEVSPAGRSRSRLIGIGGTGASPDGAADDA